MTVSFNSFSRRIRRFRRLPTPLLTLIILLVIVFILMTAFPHRDVEHEESHHKNSHVKVHEFVAQDESEQVAKPRVDISG